MALLNEPIETYGHLDLGIDNYNSKRRLYPLLKWAGGKEQELKYIVPNFPEKFGKYYEPFVGGGAVYTAVQAEEYLVNDKSSELISLYQSIAGCKDRNLFFDFLNDMINAWGILTDLVENEHDALTSIYQRYSDNGTAFLKVEVESFIDIHCGLFKGISELISSSAENVFFKELRVNLNRKLARMRKLELERGKLPEKDVIDNIEAAMKSALYMYVRHLYNRPEKHGLLSYQRTAVFLFIRNYAYSGMFRYNSQGDFNVPYGGIGYNRKNFAKKVEYLKSGELHSLLKATTVSNTDFEEFLVSNKPTKNDFIFLDPPYDSEFSTYATNEFTRNDQVRLAEYLIERCEAKWMLVIKNTDFIKGLYSGKGLNVRAYDKKYLVSFMNRNNKDVEHLMITNY